MAGRPPVDRGPIALAERLLGVLDQGQYNATYKYAVLISLLDLCLENTSRDGYAPHALTTRQVAEKVLELYWPQCGAYGPRGDVLGQRSGRQAEILNGIVAFRHAGGDPSVPLSRSRQERPEEYEALVHRVEWKLIQFPLQRLQRVGEVETRFLYDYGWGENVRTGEVSRYQRGRASGFDNRLLLRPDVGEYLVQLNGVLRPLVYRQWAAMVARLNRLPEAELEQFLFGAQRLPAEAIRVELCELQGARCLYCSGRISDRCEVDHFIPWARHPDNGIDNLVAAHARCNQRKRDFLAAAEHVERWRERFEPGSQLGSGLRDVAERARWEWHPDRTFSVARAIYLRLPGEARLWLREGEFVPVETDRLALALARA